MPHVWLIWLMVDMIRCYSAPSHPAGNPIFSSAAAGTLVGSIPGVGVTPDKFHASVSGLELEVRVPIVVVAVEADCGCFVCVSLIRLGGFPTSICVCVYILCICVMRYFVSSSLVC